MDVKWSSPLWVDHWGNVPLRKPTEQTVEVSQQSVFLHGLCFISCLGFPQWWTMTGMCTPNEPVLPYVVFLSWCLSPKQKANCYTYQDLLPAETNLAMQIIKERFQGTAQGKKANSGLTVEKESAILHSVISPYAAPIQNFRDTLPSLVVTDTVFRFILIF